MTSNFESIKLGLKILNVVIILLLLPLFVFADSWTPSQPSHSTLFGDTITSKTDASPVSIADSQGLFVTGDVTTLGKVGIGTTSPGEKLVVNGRSILNGIAVGDWGDSIISTEIGIGGSGKKLQIKTLAGDGTGITIATSGNVGIGVTSPAKKLSIGQNLHSAGDGILVDGVIDLAWGSGVPTPPASRAYIWLDSADGALKVKFSNGVVRTLATP